ncbi:hypothetical protein [Nocardioides yefusunii]|uniref:EfeO-type cupredoxin-like domain-containing protein n=1 Tax=Nocardioides yefusunii TaxID=2500546 RepID=A0ABW1QTH1_9ACTN|nr:hypothetical protein [Nocardioides yefusunii]
MTARPVPHAHTVRSRRAPRLTVLASLVALGAVVLTGCSEDAEEPAGTGEPVVVKVTLTDDTISPVGEVVKVKPGEPVSVEITADHAGELHVHSNPEQSLAFEDGTVTREVTIDTPGSVDVESHDPATTVFRLQVQ